VSDAISITLPKPPSVNELFANVPGTGRVKTQKYRSWERDAGWLLREQRPGHIEGHYELTIRMPRGRGDLGNAEKATSDLLVKHGVIDDDKFARRIVLERDDEAKDMVVTVRAAE
jgi:Holliday junction resolvase RusA-like endonuclease